jgi:hypothetical protein
MAAAIKNLTTKPIYVSLNSGTDLRLSPGEITGGVEDVELADNAKVAKLLDQRAISVDRGAGPARAETGGKREPADKKAKSDKS